MKWDDDLTLTNAPRYRGTLQLAMFVLHLSMGHTLYCRSIRLATIIKYVDAAASFLALFGPVAHDYRKNSNRDTKNSPILQNIYNDLKRYEKQSTRREAYDTKMLEHLCGEIEKHKLDIDTQEVALSDWYTCGLFMGLRLTEWAQEANKWEPTTPLRDIYGSTKALCIGDFNYETSARHRLTALEAATFQGPDSDIERCWVMFRTQKNGQNHEKKMFVRNINTKGRCFIATSLRIIRRFIRLRGNNDTTTPLALYRNQAGETALVTATAIEKNMRATAAAVYKIKKDDELQLWSAHSLRVGACNSLHAMGFSPSEIKWTLRWRSDSFMDYLRNTHVMATKQNRVLDEGSAMPNFL